MVLRKLPRLSRREQELCSLIAECHTNKEISHLMGLTSATTREYVRRVMAKTGARNRVEIAIRWRFDRRNLVGDFTA